MLEEEQTLPPTLKLLFHPFRYAVLQLFERLLPSLVPVEMLLPQQYQMREHVALWLSIIPSASQYVQSTEQLNDKVALLVATDPCFYQRIFQTIRVSRLVQPPQEADANALFDASFEAQYVEIDEHWNDLVSHYRAIDVKRLDQLHQEICVYTQMLDRNRDVHTLLRLGNSTLRLKLEGRLGGAMLLRTMAEMLRRAIERTFDVQLREEDERGFGHMPEHVKETVYGSNRLLDGNRNADNEFLRQHGLCYGPRLRWYVEGQTEFGGLEYFFNMIGATDIEILNLRGHVVQKNGIAFRESLRSDIRMGIFSFVSLDNDVSVNVQAVRAAAQHDQMCGGFFLSAPDFEFANFELHEQQEIVWGIALERGADAAQQSVLLAATATATNGKTFLTEVERTATTIPQLWGVSKGKEWGERLVRYTMQHPDKQNQVRPIVSTIRQALTSRTANYNYTRVHWRVDPQTGRVIERIPPMTPEDRQKEM